MFDHQHCLHCHHCHRARPPHACPMHHSLTAVGSRVARLTAPTRRRGTAASATSARHASNHGAVGAPAVLLVDLGSRPEPLERTDGTFPVHAATAAAESESACRIQQSTMRHDKCIFVCNNSFPATVASKPGQYLHLDSELQFVAIVTTLCSSEHMV